MKKLTRKSLDELALRMPVLSEEVQSSYVGGGTGNTIMDPLTFDQYRSMGSFFISGWVDLPDSISLLKHPYDYYFGGSGSDGNGGYWDGSGSYGPTGYWDSDLGVFVWGVSGSESGEFPNLVTDWWKPRPSCVFYCLDHIDGNRNYDWTFYSLKYMRSGGEVGNNGGVSPDDINQIVGYGGLDIIQESSVSSEIKKMLGQTDGNGKIGGDSLMMAYYDARKGLDHAVVVTKCEYNMWTEKYIISYYDPTAAERGDSITSGTITSDSVTHLYVVGYKQ